MNYLSNTYDSFLSKIADTIISTQNTVKKLQPASIEEVSEMFFAKNSHEIYSDDITENSYTEFSAIMQREITKLTKKNKKFICKQPVFLILGRKVISQQPTIIISQSNNDELNLNCRVNAFTKEPSYINNDKLVVCRHIAYGYATCKFKLDEIDSKEKLQHHSFFQKDYETNYCYYFPQEGYYFHSKYIGKVLQDIAKNLLIADIKGYKSYLLYTISHAMAVRIKFNNNYWKIKFYDPNYTVRETIIIIEKIDDIALLEINDLIDSKYRLNAYLSNEDEWCLNSTDIEKIQLNCKVRIYGDINKLHILMEKRAHYHLVNNFTSKPSSNLILALVNNQSDEVKHILTNLKKYNITELYLAVPSSKFTPAFQLCLIKGMVSSMKIYLSFILNSLLNFENKHFLVGSKVYLAIKFNQIAATIVYTNTILNNDKLSIADKFYFINSKLLSELPYIENYNTNMALSAFIKIIQQSDFSLEQQKKLLPDNFNKK